MSESKRTKGEWKINPVETAYNSIGVMSPLIEDGQVQKHGFSFLEVAKIDWSDYLDLAQRDANAEFICLAVNNHDKLVEALKSALNLLDCSYCLNGKQITDKFPDEYKRLRELHKELINSH